ncbi:hypothetical protein GCM10009582_29270 [Arthrobacter flavus]
MLFPPDVVGRDPRARLWVLLGGRHNAIEQIGIGTWDLGALQPVSDTPVLPHGVPAGGAAGEVAFHRPAAIQGQLTVCEIS